MSGAVALLDHIVLAAPDLNDACAEFSRRTGVEPQYGGVHSNQLSHMALVALGERCYLEIFAPYNGAIDGSDWIKRSAGLKQTEVFTFCLRPATTLEETADRCQRFGVEGEPIKDWAREKPDGEKLRWRQFYPKANRFRGTMPFFIDWLDTKHPSSGAPTGVTIRAFDVFGPSTQDLADIYEAIDFQPSSLQTGSTYRMTLTLDTPNGVVTY